MSTRRSSLQRLAIGGALSTALAGAIAVGCSASGTTEDEDDGAVVDQAAPEASSSDAPQDTTADLSQDVSPDTAPADVAQESASPEAGGADGEDAGAADSAHDEQAQDASFDASDGAVCSTTIAELDPLFDAGAESGTEGPDASSDGGPDGAVDAGSDTGSDAAVDGGGLDGARESGADARADGAAEAGADGSADAGRPAGPTLLFSFDNDADPGWAGTGDPNSTVTFGATQSDGHVCPGALALSTTYGTYGLESTVQYNFGANGQGSQDWTNRTKLHLWIKVTTTDYASLSGVQPFIGANNYAQLFKGSPQVFVSASTLADASWHEVVLDLGPLDASAVFDAAHVNAIGAELQSGSRSPDGGTTAPAPTVLLLDDIWLE